MTDANDILMGSGAPAAKFPAIGAIVTGTVLREPEGRQQTDFRTKVAETWKDGSPKMMVVVQLATAERDPQKPEDDGTRALYIKGKHLTDAVRQAVRASGANGIHTGGQLTVQYIADGPADNANIDPPKLYAAHYQPPAVSFTGVTAPAAVQPAPVVQTAPVQQYAPGFAPQQPFTGPAPVVQQLPVAVPAAPVVQPAAVPQPVAASVTGAPAGVDPATWVRLDPGQQERVRAAMGIPVSTGQPGY